MQFSATGALDVDKSPHKWWCRVCKVELSLMSRGVLELISDYRTDTHLVKEHLIRMEVPGMTLYDEDEKELLGIPLQTAKRVAKETHHFVPQLDSRRPLLGQTTVPCPSAESSLTEKVLFQISFIEFGLRHGGHVNSLTGVYEENARMSHNDQMSTQNWIEQRLFVSIFVFVP